MLEISPTQCFATEAIDETAILDVVYNIRPREKRAEKNDQWITLASAHLVVGSVRRLFSRPPAPGLLYYLRYSTTVCQGWCCLGLVHIDIGANGRTILAF